MEKEEDSVIRWLIEMGLLQDLGFNDKVGDNIYYVDPEIANIFPSFKDMHKKDIGQAVFDLWNLEMIDLSFDDEGEPLIALNKNSFNQDKIDDIEDDSLKSYLFLIIDVFEKHFK
jgi:hypothetical protein